MLRRAVFGRVGGARGGGGVEVVRESDVGEVLPRRRLAPHRLDPELPPERGRRDGAFPHAAARVAPSSCAPAGVFGVPTFLVNGETFWGHDRLDHLADHLAGRLPAFSELSRGLLDRPRGVDRPGAPRGRG